MKNVKREYNKVIENVYANNEHMIETSKTLTSFVLKSKSGKFIPFTKQTINKEYSYLPNGTDYNANVLHFRNVNSLKALISVCNDYRSFYFEQNLRYLNNYVTLLNSNKTVIFKALFGEENPYEIAELKSVGGKQELNPEVISQEEKQEIITFLENEIEKTKVKLEKHLAKVLAA